MALDDIPPGSEHAKAYGCTCEGFNRTTNTMSCEPTCPIHGKFIREKMAEAATYHTEELSKFICAQPSKSEALEALIELTTKLRNFIELSYADKPARLS